VSALAAVSSGPFADVVVAVFLVLACALVAVSALGVTLMSGVYDRLHYTAPSALAAVLVAAAVVVRESFSLIGNKAILLGALLLASSPLLAHVTARAARDPRARRLGAEGRGRRGGRGALIAVQWTALVLTGLAGTAVVLIRDPRRQAVASGVLGLVLGLLFFSFQAPDVALSEIVVGSVAVPAMVLLALAKIERSE
jgi:energy-converting hydrogenase B subunit D